MPRGKLNDSSARVKRLAKNNSVKIKTFLREVELPSKQVRTQKITAPAAFYTCHTHSHFEWTFHSFVIKTEYSLFLAGE